MTGGWPPGYLHPGDAAAVTEMEEDPGGWRTGPAKFERPIIQPSANVK